MWRNPLVGCLMTLILVSGLSAAPIPTNDAPISTRLSTFRVPFRVDAGQDPANAPVEVHLYVSMDFGKSWQLYGKAKPTEDGFVFRAPYDGQYWFMIRTLDRQGRLHPEQQGQPELRVVIDTSPPRLELKAERDPSGGLKASWSAYDPNLLPDTLRLEYQSTNETDWHPIALESARDTGRGTRVGETTFWPTALQQGVRVRAAISDAAGNLASSQATIESSLPANQVASSASIPPLNSALGNSMTGPALTGSPTWPAVSSDGSPLANSPSAPNPSLWNAGPGSTASATGPSLQNPAVGQTLPIHPPVQSQFAGATVGPSVRPGEQAMAEQPLLPPGERPRMVHQKSFELDYEISAVGPTGIAKVTLWSTQDGGRTWTEAGVDNDNRSPLAANVPNEGLYGFRISVESGSGLASRPPSPGDAPELWVGVDLTRPTAQLTGTEQGTGPQTGQLLIRWEASDKALAARPISLSFSDRPGGPWHIIAAELENTGSYAWQLDNRVPDRVFLKLDVRDEAGNVTSVESASAIALDRIRPEARILTVRPIGQSARGPQGYQFYR